MLVLDGVANKHRHTTPLQNVHVSGVSRRKLKKLLAGTLTM